MRHRSEEAAWRDFIAIHKPPHTGSQLSARAENETAAPGQCPAGASSGFKLGKSFKQTFLNFFPTESVGSFFSLAGGGVLSTGACGPESSGLACPGVRVPLSFGLI